MQQHADDIDLQISIVIQVARDYAADAGEQSHTCWRYFELLEKLGQPKANRSVKIQIENSFYLARFEGVFDAGTRDLCRLRRQFG